MYLEKYQEKEIASEIYILQYILFSDDCLKYLNLCTSGFHLEFIRPNNWSFGVLVLFLKHLMSLHERL